MIVTYVPGLDLAKTGAAPITDIGASLGADQPIVLLDAATGQRWPIWSELDSQADPVDVKALVVRVAKNLPEGHRFIVAMRNLRDGNGAVDPGRARVPALPRLHPHVHPRDRGAPRRTSSSSSRRSTHAGIARANLNLAWDFTVASEQNIAGRMLHIRDDAFASLHGAAPGVHGHERARTTSTTASSGA